MKIPTPLTIFLASPTEHILSSHPHVLSRCTSHPFSCSSSPHNNVNEVSRNVKVSVWWDVENCSLPMEVNALKVSRNITCALRANGIKGPLTITAFGDFIQLSRSTQESLSLTGVSLNHVPSGGSLLAHLVFWVSQNPPPAHIFLISGDKNFANILNRLRMNNYNILLASNDPASGVLCSAASITWHWYKLVRGENFSGKHLNEPPDGPWDSWYGHNRGPVAAPSPDMGQPTCTPTEDSHRFCHLVIPKDVANRICQVVNSHPEGIGLSELRSELMRSNVNLDNDFFGYKKFSFLLKSLSTYLKLRTTVDGQIIVHGNPLKMVKPIVHPQVPEILDQHQPKVTRPLDQPKVAELDDNKLRQSPHLSYDGDRRTVTAESSGRENVATTVLKEKPPSPAYYPEKMDLPSKGPVDKDVMECHVNPVEVNNSIFEVGFFRKVWRTVIGHDGDSSTMKSSNYTEICSTGADNVEMRKCDEKSVSSSVSSSNLNESVLEEKTKINSEAKDKSLRRVGMFPKTVESCNSWNSSTSLDNKNGHFSEELIQMNDKNESNRLFLSMPFWEDMLSFLHTPIGAALISQSKTREQMAQQLQREGPSHLNTLAIGDLSQLVDLLISEKKWVEESISNTFPFELILSAQTTSSLSNLHLSNELRSILSGESSQSKVRRLPGHKRQYGKKKDIQHGVSSDESSKRPFGKSKREILVDCQKLVAELFNEQPEGFNMGVLRSSFRKKYGYDLDYLKLGYPKLAVLLQTIPGVGFNCVLPSGKNSIVDPHCVQNGTTVNVTNSNSELSDSTGVHNYCDSTLKEFSPVSKTKFKQSGIFGATHEGMEHAAFDCNSYFLDEFSESEAENSIKDGSDMKRQINNNEGESSLIQLFDSFHSKNDKGTKDQLYNYDVDCSKIDLKLPSHNGVDIIPAFQNSSPKKPQKAYSFISDG